MRSFTERTTNAISARAGDAGLHRGAQPSVHSGNVGLEGLGHLLGSLMVHELVVNHERIKRTVTKLPNGIRTVTESVDPQKSHAAHSAQSSTPPGQDKVPPRNSQRGSLI